MNMTSGYCISHTFHVHFIIITSSTGLLLNSINKVSIVGCDTLKLLRSLITTLYPNLIHQQFPLKVMYTNSVIHVVCHNVIKINNGE